MAAIKEEQQALELKVHQHRGDEGLIALRSLLWMRRDHINNRWLDASGDELLQLQGEGQAIRRVLRTLDNGPAIKTVE